MFGVVTKAAADGFATHRQKHLGGIDVCRAHRGAEPAEAALKGHGLLKLVRRIIGRSDLFGVTVFSEERAFFLAKLAIDAVCPDFPQFLLQPLIGAQVAGITLHSILVPLQAAGFDFREQPGIAISLSYSHNP